MSELNVCFPKLTVRLLLPPQVCRLYYEGVYDASPPSVILNVSARIPGAINTDETPLKKIISHSPPHQLAPGHVHLHPANVLIFSTVGRTASPEMARLFHGWYPAEIKAPAVNENVGYFNSQ